MDADANAEANALVHVFLTPGSSIVVKLISVQEKKGYM